MTTRSSPATTRGAASRSGHIATRLRFFEANGGAGPRGTPTLSDGRVYTFGATGILNALDARRGTGHVVAQRGVGHFGEDLPIWGFSSSPLVVDDLVIVAVARSARRL